MNLSEIAIRRPVFAWMLMSAMIIFGAVCLGRLGVSQMPDYDFPVLNISVRWAGAAPEIMEAELVDQIEQAIVSVEGIREITSSIRQGQASVTLEFEVDHDVDVALQEVQSKIASLRMPTDVDPPTVSKTNPDDQPIMWLGVSSTRSLHELIKYADLYLRDQFQILPGVGEILLGGFAERNLRVWVDADKLRQYELTVLDVQRALELEHYESAAGYIENDQRQINLRAMGEGYTPEQVADILITQRGGRPIYESKIRIGDVARVEDGLNDIRRIVRMQGTPGVGLGIKKQRGANAIEVAKNVKAQMEEIKKVLPPDIQIGINFDSTVFIKESIDETMFTLVLSAIVTSLVCFLFLGSWQATLNILLAIPTSIIGTFMVLYFMGFTLNMFTLLGLALAVGIVVDDTIMMLENIVRHFQMGKNRVRASLDGSKEITFAVIATSLAVIAIFLPVAFMQGIIGKFFFQFGVTVTAAVALSLIESLTLAPMRCSQMMTPEEGRFQKWTEQVFGVWAGWYRGLLGFTLNHRWKTLIVSVVIFALSLLCVKFLRKEFVPAQDQSIFMIRYQTAVDSSLEFTSERVRSVERWLMERPEIRRVFCSIGGFGGGEVNTGIFFVSMKPHNQREMSQQEFMNFFRKETAQEKGLKLFVQDMSLRGFTAQRGFPVELNIRGPSWEVLDQTSRAIITELEQSDLLTDLDTDYRLGQPEAQVVADRQKAAHSGVSMENIGKTIEAAIGGVRAGKYTQDGRRYDVRVKLEPEQNRAVEDIQRLQVRTAHGELVELADYVTKEVKPTLQVITRRNRERSISLYGNVAEGKSQAAALAHAQKVAEKHLPEGYSVHLGGGAKTFKESFASLGVALIMGVLVSYMILGSQFNSFIHPFTVLLALPFSITGAFVTLWMFGQSLNLYSFIGLVLLMGIVKKNSIMLVEFTNQKRYQEGLGLREALLLACPVRLRPILMTSVSTIAAALPPALALGPGAESRIPMALAVIGGVLVSTVFTLFVVPCAYSLLAKWERPQQKFEA